MKILIAIYLVSVVLAIIITILIERVPGSKMTIRDIMDEWPCIFIPFVNTLCVIVIILIAVMLYFFRLTKLDRLWERLMDIEI
jgi:hypothetical protein